LLKPASWIGYPRCSDGSWNGRTFTNIGASAIEIESQRYRPRRLLTALLRECDLIQVVAGAPAVALAAVPCGRPIVLQVATRTIVERRGASMPGNRAVRMWRSLMTSLVDRLDDRALSKVDAVMVENRWMFDYARSRIARPGVAVHMASPGVDCMRYQPCADRASALLHDPYVLFVGRLGEPRKNTTLLCEAYARLYTASKVPLRLVVAGHGELPAAAQRALARAQCLHRVTIVGAPDNDALLALYQNATCLAVPSTEEGFGMVVIEAMACGVPVVATRCGGPEGIISDGIDGRLVPLGDANALAMALAEVCADVGGNERMGMRARETAVSRYSDYAAFKPFLDTYDRLLCI
jgi:glycosyltransferase involved in cell wall biosynthesis